MPVVRIRHAKLLLSALAVAAVAAVGCASTPAPTDPLSGGVSCEHWCGHGSATVTLAGVTTTISGGGCYDRGPAGVDARFGNWQDDPGGGASYVALTAYRVGGPTPTPPTSAATDEHPSPAVGGSIDGNSFILIANTRVTLAASGTGTFSGTDDNGNGTVTGTFTCG
jgi:hypothetical protein